MRCLIDGYNLMHAIGLLPKRAGPKGLEMARLRLLNRLEAARGNSNAALTVVFDAAHAPPGVKDEYDYHGIHLRFAIHHQQADDLIEDLIEREANPKHLTVVSDDQRIRRAAQRRHSPVLACLDFLEALEAYRPAPGKPASHASEKRETISPQEMQQWLEAFGEVGSDPEFKDVFDPYGFEDMEIEE